MSSWIVKRGELAAAAHVMDLVPVRPGIPSSEFFKVVRTKTGLQFSIASEVTADVTMAGKGTWPFQKPFYLDRRVFLPFVFADVKSDAPFMFSKRKRQLVVRHGSRKAMFSSQSEITGYTTPPSATLISKLKLDDKVRRLIHCARECSTADKVTPQLNCVYVLPKNGRVRIFATNQKILYKAVTKAKLSSRNAIPFPLFLVELLGSEQLQSVQWRKKYAALVFPHGQIWQTVPSKARTDFPYKSIQKFMVDGQAGKVLFVIASKKFAAVVDRLCSYLAAVRRQDWTLVVKGAKGSKELTLTSDVGQSLFKERLRLKTSLKMDVDVNWPLNMLEPVFGFLGAEKNKNIVVRMSKTGRSHVQAGEIQITIPRKQS